MFKGVSKQILEVTNTDNPYFEKIIFFVKPDCEEGDRKKLQKEAETIAAVRQRPPRLKLSRGEILSRLAGGALFAMAGCAVSFLISTLF